MPETKQSLHSAKSKKPASPTKKTRSASKSPSKKKTTKSSKGKSKKSRSRSRSSSPAKSSPIDLLSKSVMENAYYISHNAPQFLMYRGFSWESGNKSKKKGKKKGKKK